jgi:hypothetical protein
VLHSGGVAFPRESVKQQRGVAYILGCQSIKCSYTGAGAGTSCMQVPSSEVVLAEGAFSPRARRTLPEGASGSRARRTLPEGAFNPRARRTLPEGVFSPQARQTLPEGASAAPPWQAAGATRVVIMSCACFRFMG